MTVDESLQQYKLIRRFKLTPPRPLNIFIFIFTEKKPHPSSRRQKQRPDRRPPAGAGRSTPSCPCAPSMCRRLLRGRLLRQRGAGQEGRAVSYDDAVASRRPEHICEHVDPRHAPLCSLDVYACWSSPCCSSLWRGEIDVDGEVLVAAIRQDVVSISILTDAAPSDPTRLRLRLVTSLRLH
jgi:hypothetical protein